MLFRSFFLLGEVALVGDWGGSCAEGAGDCGGVATTFELEGGTDSMTSCPSLSAGVAVDFFFGFFFFFFLGAVDRPKSSSSTSSTVALVDRCAGTDAYSKLELQHVGSPTQTVHYQ